MSELAQQLIAENKRTKATSLDLGNCALTEVPAEVADLVWLEWLSLSSSWMEWDGQDWRQRTSQNAGWANGALTNLSALCGLTKLRCAIFSGMQVASLEPLAGLSALESLYISRTQI